MQDISDILAQSGPFAPFLIGVLAAPVLFGLLYLITAAVLQREA